MPNPKSKGSEYMKKLGASGGKKTLEMYGKDHFKKIAIKKNNPVQDEISSTNKSL